MGLARFSDETQGSLTMAYDQKMIGTVDYLAPEQALDSHKVDARADIYSLGCTLYFMLSGDAPFPQGTIPQRLLQHQSGEPVDIRKIRSDVPDELIAICSKMMAKIAQQTVTNRPPKSARRSVARLATASSTKPMTKMMVPRLPPRARVRRVPPRTKI